MRLLWIACYRCGFCCGCLRLTHRGAAKIRLGCGVDRGSSRCVLRVPVARGTLHLGGEWSPTIQFFQSRFRTFYIGNRAERVGDLRNHSFSDAETPVFMSERIAHRLAERESGRELTPREVFAILVLQIRWMRIREGTGGLDRVACFRKRRWWSIHYEVPDVESLFYSPASTRWCCKCSSSVAVWVTRAVAAIGDCDDRQRWRQLCFLDGFDHHDVVAIVGFFFC